MRFNTVFSLALVTATVAPAVMSVPLAGRQSPPLPSNAVQPPSNQTSDEALTQLVDSFLSTLTPDQLQGLSGIFQDVIIDAPSPTNTSTTPLPTTASTPTERSVKSFFQGVGNAIKGVFKNIF